LISRKLTRIPLALGVAAIALTAAIVPAAAYAGAARPAATPVASQDSSAPPRYLLTIPRYISSYFDVENAVSGRVTANIWAPKQGSSPGQWEAVAAEGPQTFVATDLIEPRTVEFQTYFYRIILTSRGTLQSIHQTGSAIPGFINGLAITPNGRYAAYLIGGNPPEFALAVRNMVTGRVIASWPQHGASPDGISIDAAGNKVAVSAYEYKPREDNRVLQWTSVLHPGAKNGVPLINLPEIESQGAALALSPDGATMYEFLQAGHVTDTSWQSTQPVTFDLAAVSTATGKVTRVLHTWRAVWADFNPQLALAPGGRYLLIVNAHSLARIDLTTGRYTTLPGKINWYGTTPQGTSPTPHDPSDGNIYVDPLAW
jgi:hypothetical protein